MKICPYCSEEIKDTAIYCHHCNHFLLESKICITWSGPSILLYYKDIQINLDGNHLGDLTYLSTKSFDTTAGEHQIHISSRDLPLSYSQKITLESGQVLGITIGLSNLIPIVQKLLFIFNRQNAFTFYRQDNWQNIMNRGKLGYGYFKSIEIFRTFFYWLSSAFIFYSIFLTKSLSIETNFALGIALVFFSIIAIFHTITLSKSGKNRYLIVLNQATNKKTPPLSLEHQNNKSFTLNKKMKVDKTLIWIFFIGLILLLFVLFEVPKTSSEPILATRTPYHTKTYTPRPIQTTTSTMEINSIINNFNVAATLEAMKNSALPSCKSWSIINKTHVGKTECVYGTVRKAWIDESQETFFMTFGSEPTDFYMLVYGGWYFTDVENYCVQAEGEIMKIGNAPVMIVDPGNLFMCD